jgi:uncharacterized protein (UPF0248 family)
MHEHPLRSQLSRIMRGSGNASEFELVYRHRGAPKDELAIKVSSVSRLGKGWFMLEDGETQIPFHRVLLVKSLRSGEVLWEKCQLESSGDRAR